MKFIIPNNIFATLFLLSINEDKRPEVVVKESSLIASEFATSENDVGLIPSLDLIDNKDLFVSSKFGLAFEGLLSNSYIYYLNTDSEIDEILLRGDVSKNEVIFSKIFFRERYNLDPEIILDSGDNRIEKNNYLLTGNENWHDNLYEKGISFSEQTADILNLPYVNFIVASKSENSIKNFNNQIENLTKSVVSNLDDNLSKIGLANEINAFIKKELPSVYFEFTPNEIESLRELLQLAYYHQIFDDIFDIKLV